MNISMTELRAIRAIHVEITEDTLSVDLADGRTIAVPLAWYPRLHHGTASERANWRFTGMGEGIHWEELDEDVSIENLLLGNASAESQRSFQSWLKSRPT